MHVKARSIIEWLLAISVTLGYARIQPQNESLSIFDTPECKSKEERISCDFINSEQERFRLGPQTLQNAKNIYIYNIKRLQLEQPVYVNISIHNIQDVHVTEHSSSVPNKHITVWFTAHNSTLNGIPFNADNVYLDNCFVNHLATYSKLSNLTVTSSVINVLAVERAQANKVVFKQSEIKLLQTLTIDQESNVLIQQSRITRILKDSFRLLSGTLTIMKSDFGDEATLVTESGSTLKIGNINGQLEILSVDSIPCYLNSKDCENALGDYAKIYFTLFIVFLSLFFLTWIGIIAYIFRKGLLVSSALANTPKKSRFDSGEGDIPSPQDSERKVAEAKPLVVEIINQEPAEIGENEPFSNSITRDTDFPVVYPKLKEENDLILQDLKTENRTDELLSQTSGTEISDSGNNVIEETIERGEGITSKCRNEDSKTRLDELVQKLKKVESEYSLEKGYYEDYVHQLLAENRKEITEEEEKRESRMIAGAMKFLQDLTDIEREYSDLLSELSLCGNEVTDQKFSHTLKMALNESNADITALLNDFMESKADGKIKHSTFPPHLDAQERL